MKKIYVFVLFLIVMFSVNIFASDIGLQFLPQIGVTKYVITGDINPDPILAEADGSGIFIVSDLEPGIYNLTVKAYTEYTMEYTNDTGELVTSVQEVEGLPRPFVLTVPELKVSEFSLGTVE